jgi:regulator of RNase E activity RraA
MLTGFAGLSTPLVAGACIGRKVPLRVAPPGIGAVIPGRRIAGRALPARHYGSVDVFLEAFSSAGYGDVLVAGNGGRADEACAGGLVVLEARAAGLGGVVVGGLHRDTPGVARIGLPVFSCGPAGPVRLDAREPSALASARFGSCLVTGAGIVLGDDDGVVFIASGQAGEVLATARQIAQAERDQARLARSGRVRPCASRRPSGNTWRGAWWLPCTPGTLPAAGMFITMMEYRQPVARSKAVWFLICRRDGFVRRTIHRSPAGQPPTRLSRWVTSATCLSSWTVPSWATAACQAVAVSSLIACSPGPRPHRSSSAGDATAYPA